jgi:hypothetical protein
VTAARPAGYSGTPLAKKLGFKAGMEVCTIDAPAGYHALVAPLPGGVTFVAKVTPATGMVHAFATTKAALLASLRTCRASLGPEAAVWVSWPKKASKVPTEVTEDTVRELALPLGFVDVKVCAVDEIWSGLKLVVRRELRPGARPRGE